VGPVGPVYAIPAGPVGPVYPIPAGPAEPVGPGTGKGAKMAV
jgi:hypothetical protein